MRIRLRIHEATTTPDAVRRICLRYYYYHYDYHYYY